MIVRPRILVVEDEAPLMFTVKTCLEHNGYRVIQAEDGRQGLELALEQKPALVILDVGLPELSGIEVCASLRQLDFAAPILMLTSRAELGDRVAGLNSGADDYLAKPFQAPELLARINALLRRRGREEKAVLVLQLGDTRIDLGHRTATRAGQPLELTKTEFALLELLAKHAGETVSRERMLDVVWGYARFPTTRTVDTHVWRLRKKLGDDGDVPRWIKPVRGEGYSLAIECAST